MGPGRPPAPGQRCDPGPPPAQPSAAAAPPLAPLPGAARQRTAGTAPPSPAPRPRRVPARGGRDRARRGSAEPGPATGRPRGPSPPGGEGTGGVGPGGGGGGGGRTPPWTGGGRRAANSPEPSLPRTGLESRKAPANRQGAGRVGATVRAGPEPLPAVPTEEKGGEPHGGRARPHPGAAESRGEASSSAQHNAACPPHRGLPCRGRPLRPAPAPRRSCTAGGRRRARFKPLPGRMSTGAGAGLGGPTAGRGPAGAAVPPSRPPARSCHLGAARGLRDPPQAMGLSNSPPPPPPPR